MIDINHIQIKQSGETVCLTWEGTSNVRLLLNSRPCFIQNSNSYQTETLPLFEPLSFELIDSDSKTRIVTALVSSTDDLFWNRKMTVLIQQNHAVRLLWGEIPEVSHYTVRHPNGKERLTLNNLHVLKSGCSVQFQENRCRSYG